MPETDKPRAVCPGDEKQIFQFIGVILRRGANPVRSGIPKAGGEALTQFSNIREQVAGLIAGADRFSATCLMNKDTGVAGSLPCLALLKE